jgi:hypothetical protein
MSYAVLGILALTFAPVPARAQACFTHPVRSIESLAGLPALIRGDLNAMSDKDGPFNGSDTIMPGIPITRFVSAGQVGDLYFVWYELGGAFYSKALALYRMKAGDSVSERLAQRIYALEPDAVCKIVDDVVDGKMPPG